MHEKGLTKEEVFYAMSAIARITVQVQEKEPQKIAECHI